MAGRSGPGRRLRDRTCRGPHCSAPIRHIDHIRPHVAGGPTCLDNGQGVCAFCNDKEQQLASVERVGDPAVDGHVVEWTTRLGTTRRTRSTRLSAAEDERQDPPSSNESESSSEPDDVEPPPHGPR